MSVKSEAQDYDFRLMVILFINFTSHKVKCSAYSLRHKIYISTFDTFLHRVWPQLTMPKTEELLKIAALMRCMNFRIMIQAVFHRLQCC